MTSHADDSILNNHSLLQALLLLHSHYRPQIKVIMMTYDVSWDSESYDSDVAMSDVGDATPPPDATITQPAQPAHHNASEDLLAFQEQLELRNVIQRKLMLLRLSDGNSVTTMPVVTDPSKLRALTVSAAHITRCLKSANESMLRRITAKQVDDLNQLLWSTFKIDQLNPKIW